MGGAGRGWGGGGPRDEGGGGGGLGFRFARANPASRICNLAWRPLSDSDAYSPAAFPAPRDAAPSESCRAYHSAAATYASVATSVAA